MNSAQNTTVNMCAYCLEEMPGDHQPGCERPETPVSDLAFVGDTVSDTIEALSIYDSAIRLIVACDPLTQGIRMHNLATEALVRLSRLAVVRERPGTMPVGSMEIIDDELPTTKGETFSAAAAVA